MKEIFPFLWCFLPASLAKNTREKRYFGGLRPLQPPLNGFQGTRMACGPPQPPLSGFTGTRMACGPPLEATLQPPCYNS